MTNVLHSVSNVCADASKQDKISEIHVESMWSPDGVQMDFVQNCRLKSFPDGVHVESTWNLWGRVKYSNFDASMLWKEMVDILLFTYLELSQVAAS